MFKVRKSTQSIVWLVVVLISLGVLISLYVYVAKPKSPEATTGIANVQPSQFIEKPSSPFFYSIGNELKYGNFIDESAPNLLQGFTSTDKIVDVKPSPDNKKAAVIINDKLYIVTPDKPPLLVLETVYYNAPDIPKGTIFYKYYLLAWHPNSKQLFIVKDKKQSLSKQSHSKEASLIVLDTENFQGVQEIITDFRSMQYFFVGDSQICSDYAPDDGSIIWKCSTPSGVYKANSLDDTGIHLENGEILKRPFFVSYSPNIDETEIWLNHYGYYIQPISNTQDALFNTKTGEQPLLFFNSAHNIKGNHVNGISQSHGIVLDGGQYVILDINGQILFDINTRQYRQLPKNTRVYRNLNSNQIKDFQFNLKGSLDDSFRNSAILKMIKSSI